MRHFRGHYSIATAITRRISDSPATHPPAQPAQLSMITPTTDEQRSAARDLHPLLVPRAAPWAPFELEQSRWHGVRLARRGCSLCAPPNLFLVVSHIAIYIYKSVVRIYLYIFFCQPHSLSRANTHLTTRATRSVHRVRTLRHPTPSLPTRTLFGSGSVRATRHHPTFHILGFQLHRARDCRNHLRVDPIGLLHRLFPPDGDQPAQFAPVTTER